MNQLKAGATLNYTVIVLNILVGLLYTPFLLRILGQSDYGIYSLVASVISYLTLLDLGFGNAIIRYTAKFRAEGKPWELCKGFDNSAVIGDFVPVSRFKDVQHLDFHLNIDGNKVQQGNTRDMIFKIDDLIAYVSQFYTLKIGDLLYTGTPVGVGPVAIGQRLEGYLEGEKLLDFYVR